MNSIGPDGFQRRTEAEAGPTARGHDYEMYWPIALAILWPVALVLVWCGPFYVWFVGPPLVLLCWALSAMLAVVAAYYNVKLQEWRRLAATSILLVTATAAFMNLEFVWRTSQDAGDRIYFYIMRPSYMREIAKLPADEPRLMVFNWGGIFSASAAAVYDESDEIASAHRSQAWKAKADLTELHCGITGYTPMGGHFYLVGIAC
jgi:hypothetical protein